MLVLEELKTGKKKKHGLRLALTVMTNVKPTHTNFLTTPLYIGCLDDPMALAIQK